MHTGGMLDEAAHILVVDDDNRLRSLLRKFLVEQGFRVTTASDAADARAKLKSLVYDLLVLDVMMPGESGLDLTADLRQSSEVPILMLTAMTEVDDRISGLEKGADDYLAKPFEPRELLLRINNILKRAKLSETKQVRFGDFTFDTASGELRRDDQLVRLTTGETALLSVLARSPGKTISRVALGQSAGTGEGRAVDVQITRLRRKIEDDPKAPRYLRTVWGEGYVLWAG
jgi:two-component system phosphate regulon response regulator OmpR